MNILVMTLGKGRKEAGNRYQTACYRFTDGQVLETAFFGHALHQWLVQGGQPMDGVVILGTTGSSWDALLEIEGCGGEDAESLYLELHEAVSAMRADNDLLGRLSRIAGSAFGTRLTCRLIPFADTTEGQYDILSAIASEVPDGAHLWMDLTHGFRHLPLLELMSALNLEEVKQVAIEGLYYGMLEKTDAGGTPVVELPFARELSRWTRALHSVGRGQLGALIGLPGMEPFKSDLEQVVHFEQLNQTAKARSAAQRILKGLRSGAMASRAGELCRERLVEQFRWAEEGSYCHRQFHSAEKSIGCRDYIHGIILLNEALISAAIPPGVDVLNYNARKTAAEHYCVTEDHHILRMLRNTLAHGSRPDGRGGAKIQRILDDPAGFHAEMLRLLKVVQREIAPL